MEYFLLIVCFAIVSASYFWWIHYQKEETWRKVREGSSINIEKRGNSFGYKRIVSKSDKEIRIQHIGTFSRDSFLAGYDARYNLLRI